MQQPLWQFLLAVSYYCVDMSSFQSSYKCLSCSAATPRRAIQPVISILTRLFVTTHQSDPHQLNVKVSGFIQVLDSRYRDFLKLLIFPRSLLKQDRLCGLWSEFLATDPDVRVLFPAPPDWLSKKQWVWNGLHLASWIHLRSYLKENVAAPV
jgi:hypothetical protein